MWLDTNKMSLYIFKMWLNTNKMSLYIFKMKLNAKKMRLNRNKIWLDISKLTLNMNKKCLNINKMRLNINNLKLNTYSIRGWISHYLGHHSNSEQSVTLVRKDLLFLPVLGKLPNFQEDFQIFIINKRDRMHTGSHEISFWMKWNIFNPMFFYWISCSCYMKYPEKPIAGLFHCCYFDRNETSSADKYYVNTNPKWSHPKETSAHTNVS